MKGFIYKGCLDEADLRELVSQIFEDVAVFYIIEALDDYCPGSGLPDDFKRKGRLFAEAAELRYERTGDIFVCLLLTESEMPFHAGSTFVSVPGDWEAIEAEQMLVSPSAQHVKPLFTDYPGGARRVSVCVYHEQGISRFTRLKGFVP
jgi:hypothetical protein